MVEMYNTAWSAHYGNDGDVKKSPECTLAIVDITPEAKVSTNDCRDVWHEYEVHWGDCNLYSCTAEHELYNDDRDV